MIHQHPTNRPNCTSCALHKTCTHVGIGYDRGTSTKPDILLIGEAPGADEDKVGRPFVGRAGTALREVLSQTNLIHRVAITNTVRCRPPANATPGIPHIRACFPYLAQDIQELSPSFIVLLGGTALRGFADPEFKIKGAISVSQWRNRQAWSHTYVDNKGRSRVAHLIATYHPAYCLRNPSAWRELVDDLLRVNDQELVAPETVQWEYRSLWSKKHLSGSIRGPVSLDLETTGLSPWEEGADILCAAYSNQRDKAVVTPDSHRLLPAMDGQVLVGSNLKFDLHWLEAKHGQTHQGPVLDTQVLAHLTDENRPSKGLKYLAGLYTGYGQYDQTVQAHRKGGEMVNVKLDDLYQYNAFDAAASLRVKTALWTPIVQEGLETLAWAQGEVVKTLARVECRGMAIDLATLMRLRDEANTRIQELTKGLGNKVNWDSPLQLQEYLYQVLKLPVLKTTDKGMPSTDEEALKLLNEYAAKKKLKKASGLLTLVLERRKLVKLVNTYYDGIEKAQINGRVHPSYNITGTVTGRLSCSNPNLQNIPRETSSPVKEMFVASPGMVLVQADYSQIELRLGAWIAKEKNMLKAFDEGLDLHTETARTILGREPSKEERTHAKTVNFGIFYGMGPQKLAMDTGMGMTRAKQFIAAWFQAYPTIKSWLMEQERTVLEQGYVTSVFGRRRRLPLFVASREEQMRAVRQACNFPVQSAAADLTLLAMVAVQEHAAKHGGGVIGNVHDSVLAEVPKARAKKFVAEMARVMANATALVSSFGWKFKVTVPTPVEIKVGPNWKELEDAR